MKIRIPCILLALCPAFSSLTASETILNQAMGHDQGLGEIRSRFEELRKRQEDSRVFSEEEVDDAKNTIDMVDRVREENIANVIVALSEGVRQEDATAKRGLYQNVEQEYNQALTSLERVVRHQGRRVKSFSEKRALLEAERVILKELERLADILATEKGLAEESIDDLARLAYDQSRLSNRTEEEKLTAMMNLAAKSMLNANLDNAIEQAKAIVALLERDLEAFGASEELQTSETVQALEKSLSDVQDIREALAQESSDGAPSPTTDSQKPEAAERQKADTSPETGEASQTASENSDRREPMTDTERQDAATRLDQVARDLEEMGDPSQRDRLESAMLDVLAQQDTSADAALAQVEEHMREALQEAQPSNATEQDPLSDALASMEGIADDIRSIEERLEQSASGEAPLSDEERAELTERLADLAETLRDAESTASASPEAGSDPQTAGDPSDPQAGEPSSPRTPEAETAQSSPPSPPEAGSDPQTAGDPSDPQAGDPSANASPETAAAEAATPSSASESLSQASDETRQGTDAEAAASLAQAQQRLGTRMEAVREQMESQAQSSPSQMASSESPPSSEPAQPGEPSSGMPSRQETTHAHGEGDGSRNQGAGDGEWASALPEKERSALRVSRQAKFSPHLEPEVTKYFLELAK